MPPQIPSTRESPSWASRTSQSAIRIIRFKAFEVSGGE